VDFHGSGNFVLKLSEKGSEQLSEGASGPHEEAKRVETRVLGGLWSYATGAQEGFQTVSSPTVTLNVIALPSVGRSTVTVPIFVHFRAIFGSQKGISGLLNGSLGLSVTVGLETVRKVPNAPAT
jgi:hypothetical protein